MSTTILVDRIYNFAVKDPWGVGFTVEMLDESLAKKSTPYEWLSVCDWGARIHAERIRYLAEAPELNDPIDVDNECDRNHILPIPIITDGHHRLFAHVWLGLKTIEANYGGRIDVLDYLIGKTDSLPY